MAGGCVAQTNTRLSLGVNIRELRYRGTEMHTVDFFKCASAGIAGAASVWLTQRVWPCTNNWNTGEQAQLDLDPDGWLRSLPNKGYLDFATMPTTPAGTFSPTTEFWVNLPS